MKEILELYLAFFKIGAVNFGGGYAMLPLLERDLVETRGWTTTEDLTDYFAIGQCTPGLIALNVATFIGCRRKGIAGAVAATVGFVSAPIVIILLIATFLQGFADLPVVQNAFAGIRVCVCVLIIQAVLRLWNKSVVDKTTLVLYLAVFLMTALSGVLPLAVPAAVLVIISGILGVLIGGLRDGKAGNTTANGKEAEK
ncbi:MAG: chromate transporter [Lachnospiraceae bacterium]|nr:chromate transporter [Lachnospiraceae bacterium]